ncbi:hypothetical protein F0562_015808 [Nyssa sinensis]|uniref:Dirigent protein n=1 Tax=Nyssa sinensis TaxID=561372 RepID=A0A5J4ZJT4_9ASTE|nr:hypothetical protein F0562_015808 [Nyssa sinensis]
MMDDPLTVTPQSSSKLVGRAQGIYASAVQKELVLEYSNLDHNPPILALYKGKYKPYHVTLYSPPWPKPSKNSLSPVFTIFLFSFLVDGKSHRFSTSLSPEAFRIKKEKLSHLHFYFHDIVSGRSPTAVRVTEPATTNRSSFGFGAVFMMDDPLTVKPEPSSKLVGRAQGIYASAAQNELGLLMVLNFAFTEGKYNGSTLSVLGRNGVFLTVREMPIVGGSGLFRFASGYAQAKTHTIDLKTGDAVVEYNVYVLHG